MTPSDADHYFFRSLGAAMLALAGSALVLAVAFVTYRRAFRRRKIRQKARQ